MPAAQHIHHCVLQGRAPTCKLARAQAAAGSIEGPRGIIEKLRSWRGGSSTHAAAVARSGPPRREAGTQACSKTTQQLPATRRHMAALNLC